MFKRPEFLNDWLYAYWGWRTKPDGLYYSETEDKWFTIVRAPITRTQYRQLWYRSPLGKWKKPYRNYNE